MIRPSRVQGQPRQGGREPTVAYHLGLAYHKKGDADKARAELTRALDLSGSFDGADQGPPGAAEIR